MRYLSMRESTKRLRAAGVAASEGQFRRWARAHRECDVWVVGEHVFIYEAELDSLIASGAISFN